jgi:hypothetical protein
MSALSFMLKVTMKDYALLLRLYITFGKNARDRSWPRKAEESHQDDEREAT